MVDRMKVGGGRERCQAVLFSFGEREREVRRELKY